MNKRNPVISFLLSIFLPGLGQVYNGELKKGILFTILIYPIYILLSLTGIISSFWGLLMILTLMLIYRLAVAIEAFLKSKSLTQYKLKPINQISKYLLFTLFGVAINWVGINANKAIIGYESFEILTPSMLPSLAVGDRIMAIKASSNNLKIGDIVTFTKGDGQKYLSRVIGLPGDEIEIMNDKALVNGKIELWKAEGTMWDNRVEYQKFHCSLPNKKEFSTVKILKIKDREIPTQKTSNQEKIKVQKGHIYVLGDNRNNTMDSRRYGTIPIENVDKSVQYVWWSDEKSRIGISLNH